MDACWGLLGCSGGTGGGGRAPHSDVGVALLVEHCCGAVLCMMCFGIDAIWDRQCSTSRACGNTRDSGFSHGISNCAPGSFVSTPLLLLLLRFDVDLSADLLRPSGHRQGEPLLPVLAGLPGLPGSVLSLHPPHPLHPLLHPLHSAQLSAATPLQKQTTKLQSCPRLATTPLPIQKDSLLRSLHVQAKLINRKERGKPRVARIPARIAIPNHRRTIM